MDLFDSLGRMSRLIALTSVLATAGAGPNMQSGSAMDLQPIGPSACPQPGAAAPPSSPRLAHFGRIPLCFEANEGQTDPQVQFLARGPGYTVFLTATEAVLALHSGRPNANPQHRVALPGSPSWIDRSTSPLPGKREADGGRAVVRMQLVGSNPAAYAQGADRLPGIANYFLGNDPSQWRTCIPTYARVHYPEVYPGISLVYYGNQRELEYDFQVAPGADPSQIRLQFSGADSLTLDERGDLVVQAQGQILLQHKPVVYQDVAGERHAVAGTFWLEGNQVGFALGRYDRSQALIIDPVLSYSTYFGGSGNGHFGGDSGGNIAVDASGSAYVTGYTASPDFPTANSLQPALGTPNGNAFVAKLSPDGSTLVYSTYLGGSGNAAILNGLGGDSGNWIAVDAAGNAYITGFTTSRDFPTLDAFQPTLGGSGATNAFVASLDPTGQQLRYSTYLGGRSTDDGFGIAVDQSGHVYVTGETNSDDFPVFNAFQPRYGGSAGGPGDAFVISLDAAGQPVYSSYLGGSGDEQGVGIAVDQNGHAYVVGTTSSPDFPIRNAFQPKLGGPAATTTNAFVTSLDPTGQLLYSTYLGGSVGDGCHGIAVDAGGNAYVTGGTQSPDFPTVNPLQPALVGTHGNAYVAELTADGSALVYSTYLGGSGGNLGGDSGSGIAVDQHGQIFVIGSTASSDFPTLNAIQPTLGGSGAQNAFVTSLSPGGGLLFSTYLGGSIYDLGQGIALDAAGNTYVSGVTYSPDFPTANALKPALGTRNGNAFVAKISP
jgi:hypothetical protein